MLVRTHQARVRAQLRRLCDGDAALADDLAQETFVDAWRARAAFRAEAQPATWLHRIALNRYRMHLRAAGSRPPAAGAREAFDAQAEGREGAAEAPDARALRVPGAEAGVAARLDVARAVARLPEAERLAVIHCFALDFSHAEAAEVLGWPLGTLKSHVARAKDRLRAALADWAEAPEAAPWR
jgi:RNA polymerase sigma-70 factor (ECF subfamily)